MARICSVNVGQPVEVDFAGTVGRTSIDKRPVDGPVEVLPLGLAGDSVSDTDYHGGRDQAVYAYAREDLDFWVEQLQQPIPPGQFGENLTTEGIGLNAAVVGTRLRIGTTLLEVCSVRTPCNTFKGWQGASGFDDTRWVRRFMQARRPGPYLRVLEPGVLQAGDEIHVVAVPDHGITVVDLFVAMNLDRSRLPSLQAIDDLAAEPARRLAARLGSLPAGTSTYPVL
ncbi:MAG: MOSC domain-containing protein [Nocardioidaceae bacterium]|nr:MOSC domain-containing protein [Nocardioidaceae bacterium]MCL2611869.1 MOSC domain-containing protein [Nocardioidaceae bacterium]